MLPILEVLVAEHLFFLPEMLPILTQSLQLLQTVQRRGSCKREDDTEFEPTRTEGKLVCRLSDYQDAGECLRAAETSQLLKITPSKDPQRHSQVCCVLTSKTMPRTGWCRH